MESPPQRIRRCEPALQQEAGRGDFAILHRPPDLCLGAVDRDHAGRRRSRCSRCRSRSIRKSRRPRSRSRVSYPGADAQVVADTVAAPIEQQVNGVEGMLYMSSQSGNDGSYNLTVTFDLGTDSEHGPGDGAEPRVAGHAAVARRGAAAGSDDQEEVAEHPAGDQLLFRPTAATTIST